MQYDVFICHASEDKDDFVRPLAERLKQQHLDVWYDEFSLNIGDSLTQKIDEGLTKSRFGIVVLSPSFFNKPWAKRELNGLTMREMVEKRNLILPIWHKISVEDVLKFSPPLADKKAADTSNGVNNLVREICKKINPDDSPLIIARNHLISLGVDSPPISDEWWLDIIEYKETLKYPDLNMNMHWIFPLPFSDIDRGANRGYNIASSVLQSDWSFEAEQLNISPITHPEKVHEFIRKWPDLYECGRRNADVLALYAPQLTIPGFDQGFEDVFDNLLNPNNGDAYKFFSYGGLSTIDGEEALCGDVIALRHPTFGNYTKQELGYRYFVGHDTNYMRSRIDAFEGLIWLFSEDSNWLHDRYKEIFIDGIMNDFRHIDNIRPFGNPFSFAVRANGRDKFKFTKTVKSGLEQIVSQTIKDLEIQDSSSRIMQKLINSNFVDAYYNSKDTLNNRMEIIRAKNK